MRPHKWPEMRRLMFSLLVGRATFPENMIEITYSIVAHCLVDIIFKAVLPLNYLSWRMFPLIIDIKRQQNKCLMSIM